MGENGIAGNRSGGGKLATGGGVGGYRSGGGGGEKKYHKRNDGIQAELMKALGREVGAKPGPGKRLLKSLCPTRN